ncbi:MAG: purine-nucleoside phosphorylase [Desulfobacterales bacterium]|jgi:purine-nucleoside phosphorylase
MNAMPEASKSMVEAAAAFLAERYPFRPQIGLMTGTGLGEAVDDMSVEAAIPYGDIPHFPISTVESHRGRLLLGRLRGRPIVAMQGRLHLYEGYTPYQVAFPVRLMRSIGVGTLLLTNAAGGLSARLRTGDVMAISDHINLTGETPLLGPNEASWGLRFPDMGRAYDPDLRDRARGVARELGLSLPEGVYAGLKGPSLETPAEVRYLKTIGADAVGFSTVQEVIAGVHSGMVVAGFSIITNVHDPEAPAPATVEDIIEVATDAAPRLRGLIAGLIDTMESV